MDRAGFDRALEAQRARSRASATRVGFEAAGQWPPTRFVGYEAMDSESVVSIVGADLAHPGPLGPGQEGAVLLDVSPFYAEAGGQVGDRGELSWAEGRAHVVDTVYAGEARVHRVKVVAGTLDAGQTVTARVDREHRAQCARHHSATHLLNQALREVLGEGIVQRGSYVGPDHTTFDFSFSRGLTAEELREIEVRVNRRIRDNLSRDVEQMSLQEARQSGAIALLDEKYSEQVRVVDFGGWSRELCGGTHVHRTGDVGAAIILSESSIGQGVRRIDMVAGEAAQGHWEATAQALRETARTLKARPEEVPERVQGLLEQNRELRRRQQQGGGAGVGAALAAAEVSDRSGYVLAMIDSSELGPEDVAGAVDRLFAERLQGKGVAAVLGQNTVAVKVGGAALEAGVRAGDLVAAAAEATGGRGGGRPEFARGGLKDADRRAGARQALLSRLGNGSGA